MYIEDDAYLALIRTALAERIEEPSLELQRRVERVEDLAALVEQYEATKELCITLRVVCNMDDVKDAVMALGGVEGRGR